MSKSYSKTRVLVECALMVAIGTVLANIKIFTMPNGGSVTLLSMLPFVLVSFRHGVKWGRGTYSGTSTLWREGAVMKGDPEQRALLLGEYIVEHGATVRAAARAFGCSKSTVHKDVSVRLRTVGPELFRQVQMVLARNKAERHLRGGAATREKYHKPR